MSPSSRSLRGPLRSLGRPAPSLVVVVVLLGIALAVATATQPAPARSLRASEREVVPVARAAAACPAPLSGTGVTTRVGIAAPGSDRAVPGAARLAAVGAESIVLASLTSPGATAIEAPSGSRPLVGRAEDGLAPGFGAAMVSRALTGDQRGLAGATCVTPGTDFWFVGSGAVVGERGRIYLTNAESAPAVVDVTLYGPQGPIDAPGGRGVPVAAGAQKVLLLDALAPGTTLFGVHAEVVQGRIAAALRDQQVDGLVPLGVDWVPPAAPPALRVMVPGVPGGAGERVLQLLVPGSSDAIVKVRFVAEDGAFAPAGQDVIEARAGAVRAIDLTPYAAKRPLTVELTSDQPVTASLLARVGGEDGDLRELGYPASAPPLRPGAPGVAALVRGGADVRSLLYLTAGRRDAVVEVAPLPPAAGAATRTFIDAGTLRVLDLGTVSQAASFAVEVTPLEGSGPVVASTQILETDARGPLFTASPIVPGRWSVRVPAVSADLSTGLRGGAQSRP